MAKNKKFKTHVPEDALDFALSEFSKYKKKNKDYVCKHHPLNIKNA